MNRLQQAGIGTVRVAELAELPRRTVQCIRRAGRVRCEEVTADAILSVPLPTVPHGPELLDGAMIPAIGSARKLRALAVMGWGVEELGVRLGWKFQHVSHIRSDRGAAGLVTAKSARKIDAVYRELHMVPGPSESVRKRALSQGWHPALAWDEDTIDDPNAQPDLGQGSVTFAEQIADYRAIGRTDDEIATALGVSVESLHRRLGSHGIPLGKRYRDIEERLDMMRNNTMSKRELKVK